MDGLRHWPSASARAGAVVGELVLAVCAIGCDAYNRKLVPEPATDTRGVRDQADASPRADASTASDGGSAISTMDAGDAATPVTQTQDAAAVADAGTVFDPDTCGNGECWWSHTINGCKSAGAPTPEDRPIDPGAEGTGDMGEIYLGWTQLRLGTTGPDGTASDTAWQGFGLDLDGVCTNSSTCTGTQGAVSCHSAAAQLPFDGELCRDNTFASLQPVVARVPELGQKFGLSEDVFNCALWRGDYNIIVRITGYNGQANDAEVRVDFYISNGLEQAMPWSCPFDGYRTTYPLWRASAPWHIDDSTLTGAIVQPGHLPDSTVADPHAYVRNGYLVAVTPDGTLLRLAGNAMPYRGFPLVSYRGLWLGRLYRTQDDTWHMRDGLTAGRTRTADLIKSFRQIGLCEGMGLDTFYQSVVDYVNEDADLLADGSVDPEAACDAMSFGFAFEAAQVTPGAASAIEPLIECCPPGTSATDCMAVCGDGKLVGAEKCDTGIAAGQPGACPGSCPAIDACTPQVVVGTACDAHCEQAPITSFKSQDGCCPPGGDSTLDDDCPHVCGNGVIETGETCDPAASCPSCSSTNPCLVAMASGSAELCTASCKLVEITSCLPADGCCPATCNKTTDNDCPTGCGDGVIDTAAGETCEAGSAKPCPASCDDGDDCSVDQQTGSSANCNVICTHTAITLPKNDDQCCPRSTGANANNDNDCSSQCGNHIVESGEQCDDGNAVAGDGCAACQNETPAQICLIKIGKSDACAQCTCSSCTQEALACYNAANAGEVARCKAVAECGLATKCNGVECYCGIGVTDPFVCLLAGPMGPCQTQIEVAAGTTDPLMISTRSTDSTNPLGRADALGSCAFMHCATECGL